jgi:hypothetical protein
MKHRQNAPIDGLVELADAVRVKGVDDVALVVQVDPYQLPWVAPNAGVGAF